MTEETNPPPHQNRDTVFTHSELAEPTFWLALESNHKLCCYLRPCRRAALPLEHTTLFPSPDPFILSGGTGLASGQAGLGAKTRFVASGVDRIGGEERSADGGSAVPREPASWVDAAAPTVRLRSCDTSTFVCHYLFLDGTLLARCQFSCHCRGATFSLLPSEWGVKGGPAEEKNTTRKRMVSREPNLAYLGFWYSSEPAMSCVRSWERERGREGGERQIDSSLPDRKSVV